MRVDFRLRMHGRVSPVVAQQISDLCTAVHGLSLQAGLESSADLNSVADMDDPVPEPVMPPVKVAPISTSVFTVPPKGKR